MKRIHYVLVLIVVLYSCTDYSSTSATTNLPDTLSKSNEIIIADSTYNSDKPSRYPSSFNSDSFPKMFPDNYLVTNDMFKGGGENGYKITSGLLTSYDKKWFRNEQLGQSLIFDLYTDYHRLRMIHFLTNEVPTALISRLYIYDEATSNEASQVLKTKHLSGFLKQAKSIDQKYFTSRKGFKLGDKKQLALDEYGMPDKTIMEDGIEVLEWHFSGDTFADADTVKTGKFLANNSFGHDVTMMYKNGYLVAVILHNAIP